jgi:hypothetical protein
VITVLAILIFIIFPIVTSDPHISIERCKSHAILAVLKQHIEKNKIDADMAILSNHELYFTNFCVDDELNVSSRDNAKRFFGQIPGLILDRVSGTHVLFLIATDSDECFSEEIVAFIKSFRKRSPEENLLKLRELKDKEKKIKDIILISTDDPYNSDQKEDKINENDKN